jgi:hypothetical protein
MSLLIGLMLVLLKNAGMDLKVDLTMGLMISGLEACQSLGQMVLFCFRCHWRKPSLKLARHLILPFYFSVPENY